MPSVKETDHNTRITTLLFLINMWVVLSPPIVHWETGLQFNVLIREDAKVLIVCRCWNKGSTFSSVILRPWVLVRPGIEPWPPALQTGTLPTVLTSLLEVLTLFIICWFHQKCRVWSQGFKVQMRTLGLYRIYPYLAWEGEDSPLMWFFLA